MPPENASGSSAVLFDEQQRIASDVPCVSCGYNQRGLLAGDNCPECGTATQRSLQGDRLQFAPPRWVATIARGMNLVVLAMAGFVTLIVASILSPTFFYDTAAGLTLCATLGLQVLSLAGYWLLLTPEPVRVSEERPLAARRVARWTHVGTFAFFVLSSFVEGPCFNWPGRCTFSRSRAWSHRFSQPSSTCSDSCCACPTEGLNDS